MATVFEYATEVAQMIATPGSSLEWIRSANTNPRKPRKIATLRKFGKIF